ncbi:MAG: hypothetical protein KAH72_03770 [Flavobacteriaceae bacterium]|nr:hypothetical protein [Flavobacteriaceae bacterium]
MFNKIIPFGRLLAGSLAFVWIIQLVLILSSMGMIELMDLLLKYKDLSTYVAFVFLVLTYPLGIVINYFSYHLTDKVLYQLFVFRSDKFDKKAHGDRINLLFFISSDRLNGFLKEKIQELSILGSSGFNFLLISILLFISNKVLIVSLFTISVSILFFFMVVWNYKDWYKIVEKNNKLIKEIDEE